MAEERLNASPLSPPQKAQKNRERFYAFPIFFDSNSEELDFGKRAGLRSRVVVELDSFAGFHVRDRRRRIRGFCELVFDTVDFRNGERIRTRPEVDGVEHDHVKEHAETVANATREKSENGINPLVRGFGATDAHFRIELMNSFEASPVFVCIVGIPCIATRENEGRRNSRSNESNFGLHSF